MNEDEVRECLRLFGEAWARADVDSLIDQMTPDAVYGASTGHEPGRRFQGHAEIREALQGFFAHSAGAEVVASEPIISSNGAVSRWTLLPASGGTTGPELGIDIWEFKDGKVSLKDAYRKIRG